ncbi:MFS transporter [Sphingobacterium sp. SRCM116780]|uniref:MFS transporter n=1 Tax=Sphingobacterium sp. SRCM116780 TaxID=2907623 RepID=UPI001F330A4B|nr:MFS transporter [Sphingobacterium sp. SRCM116780]UIR58012.1 MFS transporter [Sphingobacterium sp. SRCM116780]
MTGQLRLQLSFMMFLEYFIKGAWFVTLGTYLAKNLQATGLEVANIFSTQSLGAVLAPFFIGFIADRYFNAERVLAVLHLLGAILLFFMSRAEDAANFYPYIFVYFIAYMSSLALSNSIAFRQMTDAKKQFPSIRVWGTIGWVCSGVVISYVFHWDAPGAIQIGALKNTFLMAAVCSLILAVFSFFLPKTPPMAVNKDKKFNFGSAIGLDALGLLKNRSFLIFFVTVVVICIPISFYYQNANPYLVQVGLPNPTAKMAMGQLSEAICLLFIPFFFIRFGYKKMIMVGILAWVARYLLFAFGDTHSYLLIIGILLHGICYDFMFVVGQIYTDTIAGEKYKSSAQGLVTIAMYGIGMLLGFWVAGYISDYLKGHYPADFWWYLWTVPAGLAGVCFLLFTFFFKEDKKGLGSSAAHLENEGNM